jgi:signal peptidase I
MIIFWGIFYIVTLYLLLEYLIFNKSKISKYTALIKDKLFLTIFGEDTKDKTKKSFNFLFGFIESIIMVLFIQHFYIGHFMVPTESMSPTIVPKDRFIVDMFSRRFFIPKAGAIAIFTPVIRTSHHYDWCKRLVASPGDIFKIENNKLYVNNILYSERDYYPDSEGIESLFKSEWRVPKKNDSLSLDNFVALKDNKLLSKKELQSIIKRNIDNLNIKFFMTSSGISCDLGIDIDVIYIGDFILNGNETGPILDDKLFKQLLLNDNVTLEDNYYFFLGDNSKESTDSRYVGFVPERNIKGYVAFRIWPLNRIGLLENR